MRVNNGYNPYQYQQQKNQATGTGFADLLASQAAKGSPASSATGITATVVDGIINASALTPEQIADLKKRYDVNNMDLGQMKDLGKELFDLGVINAEEYRYWEMTPASLSGPAGLVQDNWSGYKDWKALGEKVRAYRPGDDLIQHLMDQIDFGNSSLRLLANNSTLLGQRDGLFAEQDMSGETSLRTKEGIGQVQRTLDILSLLK